MKPSCDKQTTYSLTYPFVIYIIRTNQSECSPLLSLTRDQPIGVCHFGVTIFICDLVIYKGRSIKTDILRCMKWQHSYCMKTVCIETIGSVHPSKSDTIAVFQGEKVESQLNEKGNVFNTFNQLFTCRIDIYSPFCPLSLS